MRFTDEELTVIYDRTSGKCHVCRKKLAFTNYGIPGSRAAWHVDHSNPRARGGSGRLNNLYAACIGCNCSKGARSTKSVRSRLGHTRAPVSREKRTAAKELASLVGGGFGAYAGGKLFGPWGALVGGLGGAALGEKHDPDGR
jgi:hypothetical protein